MKITAINPPQKTSRKGRKEKEQNSWCHWAEGSWIRKPEDTRDRVALRQILSQSTHTYAAPLRSFLTVGKPCSGGPLTTPAAAGPAGARGLHTALSPGRPRVGREEPSSVYFLMSLYRPPVDGGSLPARGQRRTFYRV